MTPKIRILPENLCNQIAAGEVVERPASVVKELIENALDANATEVSIEVEGGGRKLIRVTDNGDGMGKDDVFLCLERHGTSKITTGEDLFRLNTLGFRGEALPSIAAVSRVTLRSRNLDSLEGWELYVEGGTIRRAGAIGLPIGTSIEVRDLFFNTPARRKFLRKDETELGHIADLVTRLALSSPEVQFRLFHNQRPLIDTPRQPRLVERVAALLGRPLLADLATVDYSRDEQLTLRGFISRPELNRATSGAIYTYINGRYIRDRVVQHAILEGVRHLLPRGRYPIAILFLTIPSDQVDVNVHPTKHEVRFSNQHAVHDFIVAAIRSSLRAGVETAAPFLSTASKPLSPAVTNSNLHFRSEPRLFNPAEQPRLAEIRESIEAYVPLPLQYEQNASPDATQNRSQPELTAQSFFSSDPEVKGFYSRLAVIGQYKNSYILAEDEMEGLVLIDQHAAHERIGFERLRKDFREGIVARQMLLFPQIMEFDFKETALLAEQGDLLLRLGFELEHFGGRSFALKAIPELLNTRTNYHDILHDIAAELAEIGVSNQIEAACEKLLVSISCHGMVRANHHLSRPEIEGLLRDLDHIDFNACCPHGRPIHKRLAAEEIARMFRRSA